MTHREAFVEGTRRLAAAAVPTDTPELDARVLLGHAAGLNHAGLLARWPDAVAPETWSSFEAALVRRASGEPVAWITGTKEFVGLDFEVGPGLLVPRADTETLVEAALELWPSLPVPVGHRPRVADVCTGTGCVAVGVAALAPSATDVWACDVSPVAVATAQRNADRLLSPPRGVTVVSSDLMEGLGGPFDLVVSNPPYLTPEETAQRVGPCGWKEPALALDGGGDGLDLVRRLVVQARQKLVAGGWLLMEAAGPQRGAILELLVREGFVDGRVWPDLAGVDRVYGARTPDRS
jgi:release factor glutamine methyltransferase